VQDQSVGHVKTSAPHMGRVGTKGVGEKMEKKSQLQLIREAVKLLDEKLGRQWPFKINLRKLLLADPYRCVLGQLYGNFLNGLYSLPTINHWERHGFDIYMSTPLWKTKIRQLRVQRRPSSYVRKRDRKG
jgi:hypothetical protein